MIFNSAAKATIVTTIALLNLSNGLALPELASRSDNPGFLRLDFSVKAKTPSSVEQSEATYSRRSVENNLLNMNNSYVTTLLFGSNKEPVQVIIDSGSSDFWVNSPQTQCSSNQCSIYGTFDVSKSNGADLHEEQKISYADGSQAVFEFYNETVTFPGGPSVSGVQLGVSKQAGVPGILGLAQKELEAGTFLDHKPPYDNFPINLKKSGIIKKNAYSIYLNDQTATTGSIVFGGIDNAKYTGDLVKLPFDSPRYSVQLDSVTLPNKTEVDVSKPVILDTGSSLIVLPGAVLASIADNTAKTSDGTVLCDQGDRTFSFSFKGVSIDVPYSEFIQNNDGSCSFNKGAFPSELFTPEIFVLGDPFLRHIYSVFDNDDNTVSIAPVKYTSESQITSIE